MIIVLCLMKLLVYIGLNWIQVKCLVENENKIVN